MDCPKCAESPRGLCALHWGLAREKGILPEQAPAVEQPQAEEKSVTLAPRTEDNPWGKPDLCRSCPLFLEPGPVWGGGPPDATLAYVAEAPGAEEIDLPKRRPEKFATLVGGSGRLLNSLSTQAGIARSACFATNVVKCRPPANRTPTPAEVTACSPFLQMELRALQPNVVVALGDTALNALTGEKGITNWRGAALEGKGPYEGFKIFPTWHPAFIARAQYNWPFAVHDLVRAAAQSRFRELRRVPYEIVRAASAEVHGARVLDAARRRGAATFDFETTGLHGAFDSIAMVGVAAGSDEAHVFTWAPSTRQFFQELLDDPQVEIIGQNILYFDLPFAEAKGIDVSKAWPKVFDTMVAFHLCNASYGQTPNKDQRAGGRQARGMDKDLTMIASCHTDMPYWKARENYAKDLRQVCGMDCIATDRAAMDPENGLKAELQKYDMLDLYYKHVLPVHPVLHAMHKRGVKVDEDKAARWTLVLEQMSNDLEQQVRDEVGDKWLSVESPKQLMKLLYEKMGLPVQYVQDPKTKQMKPTANAEALETLGDMFPEHELLGKILGVRQMRKLNSTYMVPALRKGRINAHFGVSKTSTGRLNSWDPNAQNVPEIAREVWVADSEDHVLLVADYSQIEWRLGMVMSSDPVGLEMLTSGVDNHKAIAAEVLGKRIEDVTPDERHAAKFIVYGLGYGRGAESLAKGVRASAWQNVPRTKLEYEFVKAFIPRFFAKFRAYKAWRDRNAAFAERNHYLKNPFNRRRWWYTRGAVTEQYNFPLQSTAGDMQYVVLVQLEKELPKGATIRLTIHDEIVINALKENVKQVKECMQTIMQRTWPQIEEASASPEVVRRFYPNGWFCPAEPEIGLNWKMCKSKSKDDVAARLALAKQLGF